MGFFLFFCFFCFFSGGGGGEFYADVYIEESMSSIESTVTIETTILSSIVVLDKLYVESVCGSLVVKH